MAVKRTIKSVQKAVQDAKAAMGDGADVRDIKARRWDGVGGPWRATCVIFLGENEETMAISAETRDRALANAMTMAKCSTIQEVRDEWLS